MATGPQSEVVPCSLVPPALHPAADLLDGDIPKPDFVIAPFFPRGELIEIVGAHGSFKSTIALDACLAVATGRPWCGVPTVLGRTVFITLEDSKLTVARRVKAWLEGVHQNAALGYGGSEEAAAELGVRANFSFLAREAAQGLVLTETVNGVTTARLDVAEQLASLVTGAALVVLETASRLHVGPETNDAFAAFVRSLEHIAVRTGTALVVVRHVSKKAARDMKKPDAIDSYVGRGGGALSDAVRSCLVVVRDEARETVSLTAKKATHAESGATVCWTPLVVESLQAVRLQPVAPELQAQSDSELLLAYIAEQEAGVTTSGLHHNPPLGLTRGRTKSAHGLLRQQKRVTERDERRGRNRQLTTVYFAAFGAEAA